MYSDPCNIFEYFQIVISNQITNNNSLIFGNKYNAKHYHIHFLRLFLCIYAVSVTESGNGKPSSNSNLVYCIRFRTNALWIDVNPSLLSSTTSYITR